MARYWIGRILEMLPMLFLISLLVFTMFRLAPGDPVSLVVDPGLISEEERAAIRNQLGLDDPFPVQYGKMMAGLVNGDLRSFRSKQPTYEMVMDAFPVTMTIITLGIGLALLVAFPLGLFAAHRPRGHVDRLLSLGMPVAVALPPFLLALFLIWLFSETLGVLPSSGFAPISSGGYNPLQSVPYVIMPTVVVAVAPAMILARYLRDALTDVLTSDYIRTARAKGLQQRQVFTRHAIRNGLIPIVGLLNTIIPVTLGGSVIIEMVFGLPGLGRLATNSAITRDYPVVMATVMFVAVLTLLINLLVDIAYGLIDPRIRLHED